ncbi:MAG: DUF3524 domain-containing protein [Phycisphaerae bacterium]|nr:DUF3524 domain-containing protein [Phycisphaerae bacterium]
MSDGRRLNVLALEPYYGGSHRAFLRGLARHSRHAIRIVSLPARKWKWRMRHAAVEFARRLGRMRRPADVLLVNDFLNVAEFAGLLPPPWRDVPRVVYFHENQLTYPVADESQRDYHYAFTHLTSLLASTAAYFNSAYHRDEFFEAMERLIRRMPDYRPLADVARARRRSRVLPLGCDLGPLLREPLRRSGSAVVLWSHRWEADKDPATFLRVAGQLRDEGLDFRLVLMGEHFERAREQFAGLLAPLVREGRVIHGGYVTNRAAYRRLLARVDIAVSTARHEFFGVGVVESIAAGAWPLLPERLAYPEILPKRFHSEHLYRTENQLRVKLRSAIVRLSRTRAAELSRSVARFDWPRMIGRYDRALQRAAED